MYIVKIRKLPKQECLGEWCGVLFKTQFVDEDEDIQNILREPRTQKEFYNLAREEEAVDRSRASEYVLSQKVAHLRVIK